LQAIHHSYSSSAARIENTTATATACGLVSKEMRSKFKCNIPFNVKARVINIAVARAKLTFGLARR